MKNKCPNCGYEYGEFDIFCARCGSKIENNAPVNKSQNTKENVLKNLKIKELVKDRDYTKKNFLKNDNKNFLDSLAFNLALSMIIVSIMLVSVVYIISGNQNKHKESVKYKSLVSNPARIPELKEPQTYEELNRNFEEIEKFLLMYLKDSSDSNEKKEQIFATYLKEMDKLPHITNQNVIIEEKSPCYRISNPRQADICAQKLNKEFRKVGIQAYSDYNIVYLYPNNKFIKKKYSKYLSKSLKQYVSLKAKYNTPVAVGLNLYLNPKKLADKILDTENLYNSTENSYTKDELELMLYNDFRDFIFNPSIYDTTTHEMTKEFKKAYKYFLTKKRSLLYPVILSYMDKKRSYAEENFKNDYPYRLFETSFEQNVLNNTFSDIFSQLRKNIFSKNSQYKFEYIYNIPLGKWIKYSQDIKLTPNDYVSSEADENNNIVIYNNTFAPEQELNLSKYGKIYVVNGSMYVFNSDKLQISKLLFNGRNFVIRLLTTNEVTSAFPGIEIINIDSYSNYNIYLEKENRKTNYIVLSRYSQGYDQYELSAIKGQIGKLVLPNMFTIDSNSDTIVAFHGKSVDPEGTAEATPTYKFIIHTHGEAATSAKDYNPYTNYDEKTAEEERENDNYKPNIMPKLPDKKDETKVDEDVMVLPPAEILAPPKDD